MAHVNVTQRTLKTSPLTPPVDAFNEIGLQTHAKISVLCGDIWRLFSYLFVFEGQYLMKINAQFNPKFKKNPYERLNRTSRFAHQMLV